MKSLRHIFLYCIIFFTNTPFADEIDNSYQKQSLLAVLFKRTSAEYKANTFQIYTSAKNNIDNIALIRIEQLYPFPTNSLSSAIEKYKHAKEFMWCQEEHRNMGAWGFVREKISDIINNIYKTDILEYSGRKNSASPATGIARLHKKEMIEYLNKALNLEDKNV